jgi:hypothetical protein
VKRRADAAKEAVRKAREYVQSHPEDFEGQARAWRTAQLEAEQTGYEAEAQRELDRSQGRARDAAARALAELEREVRKLSERKEFRAALDRLGQKPTHPAFAEWSPAVERLEREVREAAARAFVEIREKALAARDRRSEPEVAAAKAEVARLGFPDFVAELDAALLPPWRPLFDGRSLKGFSAVIANAWRVENGVLIHDNKVDNAAVMPEMLGDGDIRFRFEAAGVDHLTFRVRMTGEGSATFQLRGRDLSPDAEHELLFSARGNAVSATLDGKTVPLETSGRSRAGMIQFNSWDGSLRIKAIEFREAR